MTGVTETVLKVDGKTKYRRYARFGAVRGCEAEQPGRGRGRRAGAGSRGEGRRSGDGRGDRASGPSPRALERFLDRCSLEGSHGEGTGRGQAADHSGDGRFAD